jgi:hypothetical protein
LSVEDELYVSSGAWLTLTASKTKDTLKVYPAEYVTPELAAARTRWRRPGASFHAPLRQRFSTPAMNVYRGPVGGWLGHDKRTERTSGEEPRAASCFAARIQQSSYGGGAHMIPWEGIRGKFFHQAGRRPSPTAETLRLAKTQGATEEKTRGGGGR